MKAILYFLVFAACTSASAQTNYLLIGTYTNSGKSEGIYVYKFNSQSGGLTYASKIKASNPSYLTLSPNQHYVYAAFENGSKNGGGKIGAYQFNKGTGQLSFINEQSSGGDDPCFVSTDGSGKWLAAANYSGGSLAMFPVQPSGGIGAADTIIQHTGSGANKARQDKAHVHSTFFTRDNQYLLVPDLGMDKLMIYGFNNNNGRLTSGAQPYVKTADGSGPRHVAFSASGKFVYLIQELTGMVAAYEYHQGQLKSIQDISAAQPGFKGFMGSADIHLSADGKFLYCSNRGDANTITIFKINSPDGRLSVVGYQSTLGKAPRNFSLDPSGNFLLVANQDSDNIIVFRRNKLTGLLTDTGKRIEVGKPVCLKWASIK